MPFPRSSLVLAAIFSMVAILACGEESQLSGLSTQFRSAAAKVVACSVTVEISQGPRELPNWREKARPTDNLQDDRDGSGTGIIIDSSGYVLTCCHLLDGADYIAVRLSTGEKCKVLEVLKDPVTDLAVLKISSQGKLPTANFGDSDRVQVGDWVLSVTSPYGMQESISAGIVSAVNRQVPEVPRTRLIQTDAASNPGSSGGPLINLSGQVIGVCEGSYGPCEGFHGISFAIPSNLAKRIVTGLIQHGRISRGYLGCSSQSITPELAKSLEIAQGSGVILTEVLANSPAAAAGLEVGDAITEFGGIAVHSSEELQAAVENSRPGQKYTARLIRDKKQLALEVVPWELPLLSAAPVHQEKTDSVEKSGLNDPYLGLHLEILTPETADKLGYLDIQGVLIGKVIPGSPAWDEGLCAGMAVRRLDNVPVKNLNDYHAAMVSLSKKEQLVALVTSPSGSRFVNFRLPKRYQAPTSLSAHRFP